MDLFEFADVTFRRYDTYARPHNPTEFVASLNLTFPDGHRVIEAFYRRLSDDNLYVQLSQGAAPDASVDGSAATIRWSSGESSTDNCPAIAQIWEQARHLKLNQLSELPPYKFAQPAGEALMVIRLHARIYEAAFVADDQTITVIQEGGENTLSEWVEESIAILESCNSGE